MVTRLGRRLLHDASGQVLLFGAIIVLLLFVFMLAIPNSTRVATQKMRAQTAADAGAFTGSIWAARAVNLSASLNVGVKSGYTWMAILTVGSALSQALYSDTHDTSVRTMGQGIANALFGNTDPVYVSNNIYPVSIQRLADTGEWLQDLQDAIALSFPEVAQAMGKFEACRNASGDPLSENPGGMVLVRTNEVDSLGNLIPMFVETNAGDSLLYNDLAQLGGALDTIPTNDPNIGPATGYVYVNPTTLEIKAYYGDSSNWCDVRQVLKRYYQKPIIFEFRSPYGTVDTGIEYFKTPGGSRYTAYNRGDSWPHWVCWCGEGGTHTPFIWPNGKPNPPYKNIAYWTLINNPHPGNNRYKIDTVWIKRYVVRKDDPAFDSWNTGKWEPGDPILPGVTDSGFEVESSFAYPTDFYTGADSTNGNEGPRRRLRRLNPERQFHAVSYVWQLGALTAPRGLGPPMGGTLFPRNRIAAPAPMVTVAQSGMYLALPAPTEDDYFYTAAWDARLAALDSAGLHQICSDSAYDTLGLSSLNLEELRKYVLLP